VAPLLSNGNYDTLTNNCSQSNVRTEQAVKDITEKIQKQAQIRGGFQTEKWEVEQEDGLDDEQTIVSDEFNDLQPYFFWPGYILRDGFNDDYLRERDQLSDAAYSGDWDNVEKALERGRYLYGEVWANAVRLSKQR
jgi:hypothetical protein